MSLSSAIKETPFLLQLLKTFQIEFLNPLSLFYDNQCVIALAKNLVQDQRSEHIDIPCHFIRQEMQNYLINVKYVMSNDNVSDMFTKPISAPKL